MGVFQDLREVVKRLKHRKGVTAVKYCPCCGSPRLKLLGGFSFWLTPGKFECLDCGYMGFVVLEKEDEVKS